MGPWPPRVDLALDAGHGRLTVTEPGRGFCLAESLPEVHRAPSGKVQRFQLSHPVRL